jgi:hypothetical protein
MAVFWSFSDPNSGNMETGVSDIVHLASRADGDFPLRGRSSNDTSNARDGGEKTAKIETRGRE